MPENEKKSKKLDVSLVFEGKDAYITEEKADKIGGALNKLDDDKKELMMIDRYNDLVLDKGTFSPFSYQKRAVKDFVYEFERKGILSDQVGMGKTIEAGMIISELACRHELKSLLILVPSAKMVYKWEKELSDKFGMRNYYEDVSFSGKMTKQASFPKIVVVNDEEDLNALLFDASDKLEQEGVDIFPASANGEDCTFDGMVQAAFEKKEILNIIENVRRAHGRSVMSEKTLIAFYKELIPQLVKAICTDLATNKRWPRTRDGKPYPALPLYSEYEDWLKKHPIDENGVYTLIADYYSKTEKVDLVTKCTGIQLLKNSILSQFNFCKAKYGEEVKKRIKKKVEDERLSTTEKRIMIASIAQKIRETFSVMIVGNEKKDGAFWLGRALFDYSDPALQYLYGDFAEKYSYFDLLTDMHFSTLIVDEVHNYIEVVSKNPGDYRADHSTCEKNHLFPLFDKDGTSGVKDKYLVKRSCLYAKLLTLANHAKQKMFMTATPIKSDMIDFYLLNLLRGGDSHLDFDLDKVTGAKKGAQFLDYNKLAENAESIMTMVVAQIESIIKNRSAIEERMKGDPLMQNKVHSMEKLEAETFNYITRKDLVCYLISEMRYYFINSAAWKKIIGYVGDPLAIKRMRDIAEDLIFYKVNHFDETWSSVIEKYQAEYNKSVDSDTVSALMSILDNNTIAILVYDYLNADRKDFESRFVDRNNKPIKTIQELVNSEEGLSAWRYRYGKLGIRTTRHQTDNISEPWLKLLKPEKQAEYGVENMPVWSRRNGVVINICRRDRYFDYVARVNMNNLVRVLSEGDATVQKTKLREKSDMEALAEEKAVEWSARIKSAQKKIESIEKEYNSDEANIELQDKKQQAIRAYKEEIANYVYKEVIDDGMAGLYSYVNKRQSGLPDYFLSRMHMLINLFDPDGMEGVKIKRKKGTYKILVFTKDEINDLLYEKLLEERATAEKEKNAHKEEEYKHKYGHKPYTWPGWTISHDVKDLKNEGDVLVVVPAGKYEEGVDLQMATHLVNFDILHSPLAMEQRIGRIDRVKQDNALDRDIYIYAFTPLNDWSGFSTSFLANGLHLFNRWNGDTTGIVSFPVAEKENLSSFDSIVSELESAYKIISDHAEGEGVAQFYDFVKAKLKSIGKKDEKELKTLLNETIRKEMESSLHFRYVTENGQEKYDRCIYQKGDAPKENGVVWYTLEKHIENQARTLSQKLQNIFKDMASSLIWEIPADKKASFKGGSDAKKDYCLKLIFDDLKDPSDPFVYQSYEKLSNLSVIENDLRFLYYQHFFLDIAGYVLNFFKNKKDAKTNEVISTISDRLHTANTTAFFEQEDDDDSLKLLYNAIRAYMSGEMLKKEVRRAHGPAVIESDESAKSEAADYLEVLTKEQKTAIADFLSETTAWSTSEDVTLSEPSIFSIYNDIVNKYLYHLLAIYIHLCKQVQMRLNNMARIIEDGAVEELTAAIKDDISEFVSACGVE
ncbi:MAG: DEAD/DEAH box helicase family protein [Clostridia bacterium]|nr:DEAD/DEAH box helicase family protein [Clostridia bacterium]